ncbi:Fc.00g106060.m01.CDS01 [Cosmosporella sp. VM-42]
MLGVHTASNLTSTRASLLADYDIAGCDFSRLRPLIWGESDTTCEVDTGIHSNDTVEDDSTLPHRHEIAANHSDKRYITKFGYSSTEVDLREYCLDPSLAIFLWSVYKQNVEPLIKVLHVPNTEELLNDTRTNIEKLLPETRALVFAIYFAAIKSLDDYDVYHPKWALDLIRANVGVKKEEVLGQYRFALEQSLAQADFLRMTSMQVLQALVIFLVTTPPREEDRFS